MDMKNIDQKLDRIFSIYIRLRDTDENGKGKCFVTGEDVVYHANQFNSGDCGHFIPRENLLYRWDDKNAHIQKVDSNRFQNSNFMNDLYRSKMIDKYGLNEVEYMEKQSKIAHKMFDFEKKMLFYHYKENCRELLRNKNFRVELP